jgi:hypothetical protein
MSVGRGAHKFHCGGESSVSKTLKQDVGHGNSGCER